MYARRACKMMTKNITNFTRKEPVIIRARKEDTKLKMHLVQKVKFTQTLKPAWTAEQGEPGELGLTGRSGQIRLIIVLVQIELKIEFGLTFMENVLCVFGTTY